MEFACYVAEVPSGPESSPHPLHQRAEKTDRRKHGSMPSRGGRMPRRQGEGYLNDTSTAHGFLGGWLLSWQRSPGYECFMPVCPVPLDCCPCMGQQLEQHPERLCLPQPLLIASHMHASVPRSPLGSPEDQVRGQRGSSHSPAYSKARGEPQWQ